jgi:ArsR family transcriptional regulator, arsenate/arsenite/antimonite-responsive transcriptional repressor
MQIGASAVRMNEVFRALADPTRREILRLLRRGEMTAGELAEHFDMTKPSMSHHFTVLKQADLVATRRNGQQIMYTLNTTVVQDLTAVLWDMFASPEVKKKVTSQ